MKLGDWIDHLVIFENVDYDYKEGTWTLDTTTGDDAVQPMMVSVTLQFKLIGQYQNYSLLPPLADDDTGWFGIRSNSATPSVEANTNKTTTTDQGQGQTATNSSPAGTPAAGTTASNAAGGAPAASAAAVSEAGNTGAAPTKDPIGPPAAPPVWQEGVKIDSGVEYPDDWFGSPTLIPSIKWGVYQAATEGTYAGQFKDYDDILWNYSSTDKYDVIRKTQYNAAQEANQI